MKNLKKKEEKVSHVSWKGALAIGAWIYAAAMATIVAITFNSYQPKLCSPRHPAREYKRCNCHWVPPPFPHTHPLPSSFWEHGVNCEFIFWEHETVPILAITSLNLP